MSYEKIWIRFPEFYWLADPTSFPSLTQDPDEQDGNPPRFSDKYQVNWCAVGEVVALVGSLLAVEHYEVDEEDSDFAIVQCDLSALSPEERKIVARWFQHGVSVCGDSPELENGRHRLWNCWSASPSLLLPVESSFLCATLEPDDSSVWQILPCEATKKLSLIPDEILERSPLYLGRLRALSEKCVETERDILNDSSLILTDQLSEFSPGDVNPSKGVLYRIERFFKDLLS